MYTWNNLDQLVKEYPQIDQRPDSETSRQDCQRKRTGGLNRHTYQSTASVGELQITFHQHDASCKIN